MVSEAAVPDEGCSSRSVLILVLVEDGLRDVPIQAYRLTSSVLILVLVEDGLRDKYPQRQKP